MPQIAQLAETYSSQIFWLLVIFGLVFFIIGRGMVPKVIETVGQRDAQITSDLAAAQSARDRADEEEAAWRTRENENRAAAQAIIADAKADGASRNEARLAEAQARIDRETEEAEQRIAQSRRSALDEIEAVAADATQDIVRRLAGLDIDDVAARSAVKGAMNHG